jgi:hypothetical protein
MNREDIMRELALTEFVPPPPEAAADGEVTRGYASDLLSDVLAHAPAGGVLVTLQVHLNVVAVASHAELAAVVFAGGRRPDDDVLMRAKEEGVSLYGTALDTFEAVGRLYSCGLKGAAG